MNEDVNCPFYGRHLYLAPQGASDRPFMLVGQNGNQCAITTNRFAPCLLEMEQQEIDWRVCPRVKDLRVL